eukprot:CAMPEP_0117018596 /NCGR_PEP_ID=MMETSP0472-20121206/14363_1 /TAXON_ID=693140 ORGANISM="Tiarina fusus, Strain LIS" /NCGR_SAMPLE_ID=MMETSP0472 /ASSEMBLY_ACC=CAM_ASM_000603 /LENGTH=350 /DNA_ID=CAMNT_0004723297 /DNA_START=8 /DNA_END=1060 /DNA_ORIENTATION=+
MKTIAALLACTAALVAAEDLSRRPAINVDLINEVNSDPKATWKAGVNDRFVGQSLEDVKFLLGTRVDEEAQKYWESMPKYNGSTDKAIPTSFDVVENWPSCKAVTGIIRDQANCGSCWAVSSASGMNDRMCISSSGSFQTVLSTQDVTSCCTGVKCFGSQGCDGGMPGEAWAYGVSDGIVSGGAHAADPTAADGCWPYALPSCAHHVQPPPGSGMSNCTGDASTEACQSSCPNSKYTTPFAQDKHKCKTSYSLPSVQDMQQSIMEKGTITVAFTVYENFLTYKSGVYSSTSGSVLGGHAVDIAGWGVENGTPYWLVRNSWNKYWGDNGYVKFLRGHDLCGIESQAVAGDC